VLNIQQAIESSQPDRTLEFSHTTATSANDFLDLSASYILKY